MYNKIFVCMWWKSFCVPPILFTLSDTIPQAFSIHCSIGLKYTVRWHDWSTENQNHKNPMQHWVEKSDRLLWTPKIYPPSAALGETRRRQHVRLYPGITNTLYPCLYYYMVQGCTSRRRYLNSYSRLHSKLVQFHDCVDKPGTSLDVSIVK